MAMADLRQLRAFVAVAEERSFTRAAERLHVAQQAVSKTVGAFERDLGVGLLLRTTSGVALTPAGEALLVSGREVLAAAEAAFAEAIALGRGLSGTVRIGLTQSVGLAVRAQIASVISDGAPDLAVAFREVRPAEAEDLLRRRELDVAIARARPSAVDLDHAELPATPAALFVPAGHRLAGAKSVSLDALDGERLLTWNADDHPLTDDVQRRLAEHGAEVEVVLARVTGGGGPPSLAEHDAVVLLPIGWPTGREVVEVPLAGEVQLPLLLIWPIGAPPPVVEHLRRGMSGRQPPVAF